MKEKINDDKLNDSVINGNDFTKPFTNTDICNNILFALKYNNISQRELSNRLGVSPATVSLWLKGNTPFTTETLTKISKTLNIPIEYFIMKNDKDNPIMTNEEKYEELEILKYEMLQVQKKIISYAVKSKDINTDELNLIINIFKVLFARIGNLCWQKYKNMELEENKKEQDQ